jgi:hypothetical protein
MADSGDSSDDLERMPNLKMQHHYDRIIMEMVEAVTVQKRLMKQLLEPWKKDCRRLNVRRLKDIR